MFRRVKLGHHTVEALGLHLASQATCCCSSQSLTIALPCNPLPSRRAQVSVMDVLREDTQTLARNEEVKALFLLPCHATPYHVAVHGAGPVHLRFPDCSPAAYRDRVAAANRGHTAWAPWPWHLCAPGQSERQCWEAAPHAVTAELISQPQTPTQVILFQTNYQEIDTLLTKASYRKQRSLQNCWFQVDDDYPCHLSVWRLERGPRGRPE